MSEFLTGRTTRQEFENSLQPLITSHRGFIRHHNEIMLTILTNSFREPAPPTVQSLGWSKKRREHPTQRSDPGDPVAKKLKTEVMSLTNRERARIKCIPKPEVGHRLRPNSMIETRFAKLPRVPVTPQKINSCKSFDTDLQCLHDHEDDHTNSHALAQHHIDIVRGFHAPLCTESQHLPEPSSLKDRILATCLENGLLGGLEETIPELVISGLEIHLRNLLTSTISKLRKNRPDCLSISNPSTEPSQETMNARDLAFTYALSPHVFVESAHPITRMMSTALDDATPRDREWKDMSEAERTSQRSKVARVLGELI